MNKSGRNLSGTELRQFTARKPQSRCLVTMLPPIRSTAAFVLATLITSMFVFPVTLASEATPDNPDAGLCEALQEHLNSVGEKCMEVGLQTYRGFSSPPWQNLDPHEHLELIARLIAYQAKGNLYFKKPIDLERYLPEAMEFVKQGGRLLVWRTHLLSNLGDNVDVPSPPGDQAVARLMYKPGITSYDAACEDKAIQVGMGPTFLVLRDLSGPDPRVGHGTAYALQTHQPMIYPNEVLSAGTFVNYGINRRLLGAQADVFKNYDAGLKGGVCTFDNALNTRHWEK